MDLFDECHHRKELSLSITLAFPFSYIYKIDWKHIKKYQPISFLCVDKKIIAKTMAKKMNIVMHKVVLDDQICFNFRWNINENIIIFLEI